MPGFLKALGSRLYGDAFKPGFLHVGFWAFSRAKALAEIRQPKRKFPEQPEGFGLPATSKGCLLVGFVYLKASNKHPLDVAGMFPFTSRPFWVPGIFEPFQDFFKSLLSLSVAARARDHFTKSIGFQVVRWLVASNNSNMFRSLFVKENSSLLQSITCCKAFLVGSHVYDILFGASLCG